MRKVDSHKESDATVYPNKITNIDDDNGDGTINTINLDTMNASSTFMINNSIPHLERTFTESSKG